MADNPFLKMAAGASGGDVVRLNAFKLKGKHKGKATVPRVGSPLAPSVFIVSHAAEAPLRINPGNNQFKARGGLEAWAQWTCKKKGEPADFNGAKCIVVGFKNEKTGTWLAVNNNGDVAEGGGGKNCEFLVVDSRSSNAVYLVQRKNNKAFIGCDKEGHITAPLETKQGMTAKFYLFDVAMVKSKPDVFLQTPYIAPKKHGVGKFQPGFNFGMIAAAKLAGKARHRKNLATKLHLVAHHGNVGEVKAILEKGISVNDPDLEHNTILHYAAKEGHHHMFDFLMDHNADVHMINVHGETALHLAAEFGHEHMVDELIKHGSNINLPCHKGWSALMMAAGNQLGNHDGHGDCVRLLLAAGATLDHKNEDGDDALQLAIDDGEEEIAAMLREAMVAAK